MKTALFLAALLGFASLAFANDAMYDAQPSSFMKMVSASYDVEDVVPSGHVIHVTSIVEFSNACMAPLTEKEVIMAEQVNDTHLVYNFTLLQLNNHRICPAIVKPVSRMVHVGHIHVPGTGPFVAPNIYVNGVLAK